VSRGPRGGRENEPQLSYMNLGSEEATAERREKGKRKGGAFGDGEKKGKVGRCGKKKGGPIPLICRGKAGEYFVYRDRLRRRSRLWEDREKKITVSFFPGKRKRKKLSW